MNILAVLCLHLARLGISTLFFSPPSNHATVSWREKTARSREQRCARGDVPKLRRHSSSFQDFSAVSSTVVFIPSTHSMCVTPRNCFKYGCIFYQVILVLLRTRPRFKFISLVIAAGKGGTVDRKTPPPPYLGEYNYNFPPSSLLLPSVLACFHPRVITEELGRPALIPDVRKYGEKEGGAEGGGERRISSGRKF